MRYLFIEVPQFDKLRDRYFKDDEDFGDFQADLAKDPRRWDIMQGCGVLRKARWSSQTRQKGKRGGNRIIYLMVPIPPGGTNGLIFLVYIYGKDEKSELEPKERKLLKQLADILANDVRENQERWQ